MTKEKKKNHYIDNEEFQAELVEYTKLYEAAKKKGLPAPQLSNSVGAKILLMVDRISYQHNYAGYPFLDVMKGHAIENCIKTTMRGNYNVVKYDNPFGYYTKIINWAFWEFIKNEKAEFYKKALIVQNSDVMNMESSTQAHDSDGDYSNQYASFLRGFYDMEIPDDKPKKKKDRARRTNPNIIDMTKLVSDDEQETSLSDLQDD